MKITDIEERITVRANAAAQAKIEVFKKTVQKALSELVGHANPGYDQFGHYGLLEGLPARSVNTYTIERAKLEILKLAMVDHKTDNGRKDMFRWPSLIWDIERGKIRDELMSKMDLMQQLLIHQPRSDANDVPNTESYES